MNTFTITVKGLPSRCQSCGHSPGSWPLGCFANQITVSCPGCHIRLGHLVAEACGSAAVLPEGEARLSEAADLGYAICRAHPDGCVNYPENEHAPG